MVQATGGKLQCRPDVIKLQVRHLFKHFLCTETLSHEIQNIHYPDTHAANAGPATALGEINRDTTQQSVHPASPYPSELPLV